MNDVLILLAHGSRDARWRGSVEDLAENVQAKLPDRTVRVAFMQFAGPTLEDVVGEAEAEGSTHFTLLPLFMASAGHVDKDIKPLVGELQSSRPTLGFALLEPVGEHPEFAGFIVDNLTEGAR